MHLSQHKLCTRKTELSCARWNFISTFTELHAHSDERWPTEVTSNTYFRGVQFNASVPTCLLRRQLKTNIISPCREFKRVKIYLKTSVSLLKDRIPKAHVSPKSGRITPEARSREEILCAKSSWCVTTRDISRCTKTNAALLAWKCNAKEIYMIFVNINYQDKYKMQRWKVDMIYRKPVQPSITPTSFPGSFISRPPARELKEAGNEVAFTPRWQGTCLLKECDISRVLFRVERLSRKPSLP